MILTVILKTSMMVPSMTMSHLTFWVSCLGMPSGADRECCDILWILLKSSNFLVVFSCIILMLLWEMKGSDLFFCTYLSPTLKNQLLRFLLKKLSVFPSDCSTLLQYMETRFSWGLWVNRGGYMILGLRSRFRVYIFLLWNCLHYLRFVG